MSLSFYKYQGTGNDFIMIDNRDQVFFKNNTKLIKALCDRKFGIGADGLILIENHPEADFKMVYYNADGTSSLCGNGGRCAVAFAKQLNIVENEVRFEAIDGMHTAFIENDQVHLKMQDVGDVKMEKDYTFINTGSPHHIEFADNLDLLDVKKNGSRIRNSSLYGKEGSNINFVEEKENSFNVRTYERGVEDETLSCGTGVTAVALAMHSLKRTQKNKLTINTRGGELAVAFTKTAEAYVDIFLIGPATFVYSGVWPS